MSLRVQTSSPMIYPSSPYSVPAPAKTPPPARAEAKPPTELKAGDGGTAALAGIGYGLIGGGVCGVTGLLLGCAFLGPWGILIGLGAALVGTIVVGGIAALANLGGPGIH